MTLAGAVERAGVDDRARGVGWPIDAVGADAGRRPRRPERRDGLAQRQGQGELLVAAASAVASSTCTVVSPDEITHNGRASLPAHTHAA